MGWERRYDFSGQDPLGFAEAAQMLNELGDLDQLEQMLRGASAPGALAEVDVDRARDLLGDDAARSLEQLSKLAQQLEDAGLINNKEGKLELTPKGLRKIGRNALSDLFSKLAKDKLGRHEMEHRGIGHERTYDTKPYEFGDPFNLQIERTVRNAIRRTGGGTPVRLTPDDFEIEQTEQVVRSSTVLMLDLSLSMPMRDNFLAAKKVAMALHSLISMQFPRDFLGIVGFSEVARVITPEQLPEVSWDFVYGTNMQHAFLLSRQMLARQTGTKQIIMITDGEPTAHFEPGMAQPFFSYPPVQETIDATLREVARCTKDDIRINTFMLDATPYLRAFVEKLTQMNRGRAFFTTPETLGDYVLVDFIEQKRAMRTARDRRPALSRSGAPRRGGSVGGGGRSSVVVVGRRWSWWWWSSVVGWSSWWWSARRWWAGDRHRGTDRGRACAAPSVPHRVVGCRPSRRLGRGGDGRLRRPAARPGRVVRSIVLAEHRGLGRRRRWPVAPAAWCRSSAGSPAEAGDHQQGDARARCASTPSGRAARRSGGRRWAGMARSVFRSGRRRGNESPEFPGLPLARRPRTRQDHTVVITGVAARVPVHS